MCKNQNKTATAIQYAISSSVIVSYPLNINTLLPPKNKIKIKMLRLRIVFASLVRHIEATAIRQNATTVSSGGLLSSHVSRLTSATKSINSERHFSVSSTQLRPAALSSKPDLVAQPPLIDSARELDDFMTVFPHVVREVAATIDRYDRTKAADASSWLTKAMMYNVPKGKRNRGLLTVSTFKLLQTPGQSSEGNFVFSPKFGFYFE